MNWKENNTMNVQEIMSSPPATCRQEESLNSAARLMWERDCGAIPVTNQDGKVVGIVTDRDICMAAYTRGLPLQNIQLGEVMAKQVFSCHPSDPLDAAEALMQQKQVRRVPVVDGQGKAIGMLSLNDIARRAAASGNGMQREVTQTLSAICQPRRAPRAAAAQ
jgi:CBS domain-containing protein